MQTAQNRLYNILEHSSAQRADLYGIYFTCTVQHSFNEDDHLKNVLLAHFGPINIHHRLNAILVTVTIYPSFNGLFQHNKTPCHKVSILNWSHHHGEEFSVLLWPSQSPALGCGRIGDLQNESTPEKSAGIVCYEHGPESRENLQQRIQAAEI